LALGFAPGIRIRMDFFLKAFSKTDELPFFYFLLDFEVFNPAGNSVGLPWHSMQSIKSHR
jgi:hypothetical protein